MTDAGDKSTDRGLWDFAVWLYSEPGVSDACLDLQDRLGLDVDLLLFAVWSAAEGPGRFDASAFEDCIALTAEWREQILKPLRALRRAANDAFESVPSESSRSISVRLRAVELEAERVELTMLERWAGHHAGRAADTEPAAAAASNLVAYLAAARVDTRTAAAAIRVLLARAFSPPPSV